MGQTLTAFLAMMMVMVYSLNQLRSDLEAKRQMMSAELEVMAHGVATDLLQRIGTKAFDANVGSGSELEDASTNDLTGRGSFGFASEHTQGYEEGVSSTQAKALIDVASDIDDFDGMPTIRHEFFSSDDKSYPFDVDIDVRYVDAAGNASNDPTWFKEVTLTITDDGNGSGTRVLRRPVVIKRIYSPL